MKTTEKHAASREKPAKSARKNVAPGKKKFAHQRSRGQRERSGVDGARAKDTRCGLGRVWSRTAGAGAAATTSAGGRALKKISKKLAEN